MRWVATSLDHAGMHGAAGGRAQVCAERSDEPEDTIAQVPIGCANEIGNEGAPTLHTLLAGPYCGALCDADVGAPQTPSARSAVTE
jgi:hypothetical protein